MLVVFYSLQVKKVGTREKVGGRYYGCGRHKSSCNSFFDACSASGGQHCQALRRGCKKCCHVALFMRNLGSARRNE